jgi:hypothetical protein
MIAPDRTDTRLVRQVAAYLCRIDARHASTIPHLIDPRYRAIRRATGRRDLLRNLKAAQAACG